MSNPLYEALTGLVEKWREEYLERIQMARECEARGETLAAHGHTTAANAIGNRTDELEAALAAAVPAPPQEEAALGCGDCGALYSAFPLDTTLPDEQWRMVHPDDGGVLCASCIVRRAGKLPGVIALRARIEFAGETRWETHAATTLRQIAAYDRSEPHAGLLREIAARLDAALPAPPAVPQGWQPGR